MSGLSVPTPGWLAMHLARYGAPMALSLLGVAATLHDGKASDDEINEWYAALAADQDSVFTLNQHYIALEQAYPYLAGYLGALTAWTENPADEHWAQLQVSALLLTDIAWSRCEPKQQGDLLGAVYAHLMAIGGRRTKVFNYVSPQETVEDLLERPALVMQAIEKREFTDLWCGSGTRAVAVHDLLLIFGHTPYITWRLNDPSGIAIAMCGLNMVSHDMGPDVTLHSNRDWAEMWAASSVQGRAPAVLRSLPPELAQDVPVDPRRLGR